MTISGSLTIVISFLLSILLMIIPLAPWLTDIWPLWIIPVMIYWLMALPHRVGLFSSWCAGLLLDILFNSLLGIHAFILLLIAVLFQKMARRFSFFSGLQQMLMIVIITALYLALLLMLQSFTTQATPLSWWPVLTTALVWPIIHVVLRYYKQCFRLC